MTDNHISVTLPSDERWLHFVHDTVRRYGGMVGFSPKLEEMFSCSVMEACEELFRLSAEASITDSVDLHMDFKGGAVVVDISYNRNIPLNPHEAEDFEVPDQGTELDDLDASTLWLHLIKRRMDRVRFMVRGRHHVLRLVKYRREEGKEMQAWIMSITPKLRKRLILHLNDPDAEFPTGVLQDKGQGALKLGVSETFIVRNMDGVTSFHDLYMAHADKVGLMSPAQLVMLYEKLERLDMLASPDDAVQNSKVKRLVRRIINPNFTIPHADRVVSAVHTATRPLFSFAGLILLLGIGLSGVYPWWGKWDHFREIITGLEAALISRPMYLIPIYFMTLGQVAFHEFGHGAVCKHYGGKVPRMGIMFYLAMFIFYCDTTAAWTFPDKRQRILVSMGGPLVSFALLGAGLWGAAYYADTGSGWKYVFVAFSMFTFFGLVMNFNPFIKMDAYYMLVDYTGISNLRTKSFKFLEHKIFDRLGFESEAKGASPPHTKRERRIFWWYGILGSFVTVFFLVTPLVRIKYLLTAESVSQGRLFVALLIGALLLARLARAAFGKFRAMRYREYKIQ
ncbi:hypothetical protein [Maridesulfovibrio sp.]|uniref:hypothetical protein n=1 Tax=Maridesulfovibrio sp. TaxID=2795000 RepID=UPI0039EED4CA